MNLSTLLERVDHKVLQGTTQREIQDFVLDSRKSGPGSVFICIPGMVVDGHDFAEQVILSGAAALIVEHEVTFTDPKAIEMAKEATIIQVEDARYACAILSAAYFGYPAEQLKVIGITGTKGKTTTTYMVKEILERVGFSVGLLGTIDVMEVSSQGLMLHRTAGIPFSIGVFTNLAEDHIGTNEHKDFADYLHCKSLLFKQCEVGIGNIDDEHYEEVFRDATCKKETFGFSEKADLRAENVELVNRPGYLGIAYDAKGTYDFHVEIDIPGRFSVYNSLTAIAICRHFDVPAEKIQDALKDVKVKGRVEMIPVSDDFTLMIDYAHNAMALESLLTTLKEYEPKRIVCLFGCGGDRAKARRFEMGEVSGNLADLTVITSDNPRTEDPQAIIDDIKVGMQKTDGEYVEICSRPEAIEYVIRNGQPGDVIVLAGKGHEDYQEINGVKYDLDERDVIADVLKRLNG